MVASQACLSGQLELYSCVVDRNVYYVLQVRSYVVIQSLGHCQIVQSLHSGTVSDILIFHIIFINGGLLSYCA